MVIASKINCVYESNNPLQKSFIAQWGIVSDVLAFIQLGDQKAWTELEKLDIDCIQTQTLEASTMPSEVNS